MSDKPNTQNFLRQVLILLAVALIIGVPIVLFAGDWNAQRAREDLQQRSKQVLALHKETIFGLLDKFRLMTVLVARRPDSVERFVRHAQFGGTQSQIDLQNFAGRLAAMSGANQVRLALPDGRVIAQSSLANIDGAHLNEGLRIAALQDRLGRATSFSAQERNTYSFAASVRDGDKIIGIINIDVDLQVLENAWALSQDLIFVTNPEGKFIVGNQLAGLLEEKNLKSYGPEIKQITAQFSGEQKTYLASAQYFPHIGWTLNVLIDQIPQQRARSSAMTIAALIVAFLAALTLILLQIRLAYVTNLQAQRNASGLLEEKVAKRTEQLQGSNKKLRQEFDERVAAEAALKQAQDSLIQSAKLAAIGQMSTALAHEYNQPLAAIRSYADNAQQFLKQKKVEQADDNLHRIAQMTERMAQLSKTLKTFARTPRTKLAPVSVLPLLEEACLLVGPSAKTHQVDIKFFKSVAPIYVMAGHVRLSQVVINLLSNALDAVANLPDPKVEMRVLNHEGVISISVEDSGPGVPKKNRHKIFDAFYTSKEVGDGLGLGLSIAYNIIHDFGGKINVSTSDLGGAKFVISLPEHDPNYRQKADA